MWWLWLVLMIAVAGFFIYRTDKKIKAKFDDKFNPDEWDLPRSVELTADSKPQPLAAPAAHTKLEYTKKSSVFTDNQHHIFNALHKALDNDYILLANINAADVLQVAPNSNVLATQVATKNIAAKQFDFVVCDKTQLTAVCAIVLGDTLEPMLVSACENAQLPLARFKIQPDYDIAIIRVSLLKALGRSENVAPANYESALDIADMSTTAEQQTNAGTMQKNERVESGIKLQLCPTCSGVMLKRKAKTGASTGQLFWICSTYPKCRGMLPVK